MPPDLAELPLLPRSCSGSFANSPAASPLRVVGNVSLLKPLEGSDLQSRISSGVQAYQHSTSPFKTCPLGVLSPLRHSEVLSPLRHSDSPSKHYGTETSPSASSPSKGSRHDVHSLRSRHDSPTKPSSGWSTPQQSKSPCKSARRGVLSPIKPARTGPFENEEDAFESFDMAQIPPTPKSWTVDTPKMFSLEGTRCTSGSISIGDDTACLSPCRRSRPQSGHLSPGHLSPSRAQSRPQVGPLKSTSIASGAVPLPASDVDWLMATLSADEMTRFHRRFFVNDCRRRFNELDSDSTGLLGVEQLRHSLVEMYPTLKLELKADGHHIPSVDKSIPSLIATFDSNSDGYLDFDDFQRFAKFQHAWRGQCFLSKALEGSGRHSADVHPVGDSSGTQQGTRIVKNASLPQLGMNRKPASRKGKSSKKYLKPPPDVFEKQSDCSSRPSSSASCSTRCSTSRSSQCDLDSSRGAFYSSLVGFV